MVDHKSDMAENIVIPRMLSPTLPEWVDQLLPPQRMLSPTLPEMYEQVLDGPDVFSASQELKSEVNSKRSTMRRSKPPKTVADSNTKHNDSVNNITKDNKKSYMITLKLNRRESPRTPAIGRVSPSRSSSKTFNSYATSTTVVSRTSTPVHYSTPTAVSSPANPSSKRRSLPMESVKKKKERISREYSSSEDDSTPLPSVKLKSNTGKNEEGRSPNAMTRNRNDKQMIDSEDIENKTFPTEKREKFYRLLRGKMHKWIDIARAKKHDGDDATNKNQIRNAQVIMLDSLLTFIVGFDYEDRGELMMKREPGTSSWSTLIPYISRMVKLFEMDNNRDFIGLVYQLRALIEMRILKRMQSELQRLSKQKSDSESEKRITELIGNITVTHDTVCQDFKKGFHELGLETIQKRYPRSWAKRSPDVQPISDHEGGYRPLEDPYFLPLHMFSTVQEATAFGYALTKEWTDVHGIEYDWALAQGLK